MFLRIRNSVARVVRDVLYPPHAIKDEIRDSEEEREPVEAWWERHHSQRHKLWISGSRPERVWSLLNVSDRLNRGSHVLDIGVGTGNASKRLHSRGCKVDALDISEAALAKVRPYNDLQFRPISLEVIPASRYDAAISFLVAQHMSNAALRDQLRHVIRSLKPDGIFAIQIAFAVRGSSVDSSESQKSGSVMRSEGEFSRMVKDAGGRIAWSNEIGRFPEYGSGWMAYHVSSA